MVTRCTPLGGPCLAAAATLALAACAPDPVAWATDAERRIDLTTEAAGAAPSDAGADSLLAREVHALAGRAFVGTAALGDGRTAVVESAELVRAPTAPDIATLPPEAGGTRCPASLRVAVAPRPTAPLAGPNAAGATAHAGHAMPAGGATGNMAAMPGMTSPNSAAGDSGRVAVWWALRPDRSAALYLARSADGGRTWGAPLPVDTLDRSEAGCERPAPSVAADSANGYVHVAYSMRAPEGPGVFYAHQMDPRAQFERPQVIVYGERPAATSVASRGDRVVVAYEDPNTGGRPFVSIALSRTAGHAWAERVPVTGTTVAAERPVVALRGRDGVLLGYVERRAPRSVTSADDPRVAVAPLPSGVVVRVGRLRE